MHKEELRWRAHEYDNAAAGVLPAVLADDECFQARAERVAAAESAYDRRVAAEREAAHYVSSRGRRASASRAAMVQLLLYAAEKEWEATAASPDSMAVLRRDLMRGLPGRALWLEAEPADDEPVRLRARIPNRLEHGARYVARFGAHVCISCGKTRIARDREARRREHHCERCERKLPDFERRGQREAMRAALEAYAGLHRHRRGARRIAG